MSYPDTVFDSWELSRLLRKTNVEQPKGGDEVGDGWALTEVIPHQEARCSTLLDGPPGSPEFARH